MLLSICPKLPMRNKETTKAFYQQLGFEAPNDIFPDYLMMKRDMVEIHFFLFPGLVPEENYGQVYIRVDDAAALYGQAMAAGLQRPEGVELQDKPWRQREFSLLDPDTNLLTFGQSLG
jgi:catechol 2,3-dioxygenase-like lactoylglutathione lyase family enzyme